ncbi:unnamed protein product [Paramecium sonneborni]|uniref:Uncharacterized protein n=1 Tax=Paramecium sonneborni TaxID=65129 RepID=A0A8S1K5T7_9CILI|nr:unnamed protein product [Paramecium sonneborni]
MQSNKKIEQNFNELLFLPHINSKSIAINDSMRRQLSLQCKDNFLQFLVVQKAGKVKLV